MQKRRKRPIPLVTIFFIVAVIIGFVSYRNGWDFDYRHYGILLILFFALTVLDGQRAKRRMTEALLTGDYAYALAVYERELAKLSKKKPQMVESMKLNMGICYLNKGDVKVAETVLTDVKTDQMEESQKALHAVYLAQAYLLQEKQSARAMKLLMDGRIAFYMKGSEAVFAFAAASLNQFEDARDWIDQAESNAESNQVKGFKGYLTPDYRLERMLYQFYIGAAYHRMDENDLGDQWWSKLKDSAYENVYSKTAQAWKTKQ